VPELLLACNMQTGVTAGETAFYHLTEKETRCHFYQIDTARSKVEGMNFLSADNLVAFSIYSGIASLQVYPSVMVRVCTHLDDLVPHIAPDSDGLHVRGETEGLEVVCVCNTPQQAINIVEAMKVFA
jgi:hypothetical protein